MSVTSSLGPVVAYGPVDGGVLLVGQAPNRWMMVNDRPDHALWRRDLMDLARLTPVEYYRLFTRCNLLQEYPGSAGKGDKWLPIKGRENARDLSKSLPLGTFEEVVLMGKHVAKAFGLDGAHWFQGGWGVVPGAKVYVAPHPSRVSRWWNDPENVRKAEVFWTGLAGRARQRVELKARILPCL